MRFSCYYLLLTCSVFSLLAPLAGAAETAKPNVLMIILDDLNDWVGCLGGHSQVRTPNMDRLAQRGLLFTNAHVPAPVCNPCRASVLTGRSPGSTGIYANDVVWHEAFPGITSLPSHFKANGYHEWHNLATLAGYARIKHALVKSLPKQDADPLGKQKKNRD